MGTVQGNDMDFGNLPMIPVVAPCSPTVTSVSKTSRDTCLIHDCDLPHRGRDIETSKYNHGLGTGRLRPLFGRCRHSAPQLGRFCTRKLCTSKHRTRPLRFRPCCLWVRPAEFGNDHAPIAREGTVESNPRILPVV